MLIKAAEEKSHDLAVLEGLLSRSDVSDSLRDKITHEIRAIRGGAKGERDATYEIEFQFANNPNVMTIHDLRLEIAGRVAQIDHLLIDRFFDIWVCESKTFSEGVSINEHGEWSTFSRGRAYGIQSPIEQN